MARGRRKVTTESLDMKIEQQKEELMEAVIKSDRTYEEILAYIKGGESE